VKARKRWRFLFWIRRVGATYSNR